MTPDFDILQFQAGREAAIQGKPRDGRRGVDWKAGWDQEDRSSKGWRPIAIAPKDGRTILLTAFENDGQPFEIHPMQWMAIQRNGLYPGVTGMWTAPSGEYTWNGSAENGGPTHWRPVKE